MFVDNASHSGAPRHILCVDDDVLGLQLRGCILEREGYTVTLVSDPCQALTLHLFAFALAILDFGMPGMNGLELLLRLRQLHAGLPVLLLAADAAALPAETRALFSMCLDKALPVKCLLDNVALFLDSSAAPGSLQKQPIPSACIAAESQSLAVFRRD